MRKVIWTPTARESLLHTTKFIGELWDEQMVNEFLNQLNFRIEQIKSNPELEFVIGPPSPVFRPVP